jgi:hypothetical protein
MAELYDNIPMEVEDLLKDIKSGKLGLPDLQRPFVWKDNKVRDLLDSMLKGFPIGYIMIWSAPEDYENVKQIGLNEKNYKRSEDLVIDGQQRLTSLIASMYGIKVRDKHFKERRIRIVYNPLEAKFEVWSNRYEKDPEWINDISKLFEADDRHEATKFRKEFIKRLNEYNISKEEPELTDDQEIAIEENLNALLDLKDYSLPVLKIRQKADEEDVADIFKRVNSGGQNLNENNFIETLLSVYDNDVHDKIMKFCSDSRIPQDGTSFNNIIDVDPTHLIRMAVGYGFNRARMKYGYKILRGKNLKTGETSEETRKENLEIFKKALDLVMDINNWHAYLNLFPNAGYIRGNLVSSSYVVIYGYVWYLMGKYQYHVSPLELRKVITKFIFMSLVRQYYGISPESSVEKNFADLRDIKDAQGFVDYFNREVELNFTEDFFSMTLPDDLHSSSAISPSWYGYIAAINVLGTPMLFSTSPLSVYWEKGGSGKKKAIDKHHIFPKNYLKQQGFDSDRDRNQIANFTYLDYNTNIDIADNPPADYVGRYREKLGEEGYKQACEQNALPLGFETMDYFTFLEERRKLMSGIIKKAYKKLCE